MNKIYTLLIILVLGCVSCGDFLEEDSQTLSYVTSVEDLEAGIYRMQEVPIIR